MKRFLAILLALAAVLTMAACGSTGTAPETTAAPTEEKIQTNVAEPLTWEKINAIPVANDSMTEEELRQICLDTMRMQLTFTWTPSVETPYNSGFGDKTFYLGAVYGGAPYQKNRFGNIYKMMYFYDEENGMMDLSEGDSTIATISNQCAGAAFTGWARACNAVNVRGTADITEFNGCLRVGPYTYDSYIATFTAKDTKTICTDNGDQVMYESYAAAKPADGLVNYVNAGHVRMISGTPNVVRNADGTIDGYASTLTYMDQIQNWTKYTQSNGVDYEVEGGIDIEVRFEDLFVDGYLPFTLAELNKQDPVEKAEASIGIDKDSVTTLELARANLTANYIMSDITVTVKDSDGKEVHHKDTILSSQLMTYESILSMALDRDALDQYTDGSYTIEISTRVGTGEKIVAYSGKLTA